MDVKSYEQSLNLVKYIMQMRPVFNADAVFSDETESFVSPMEADPGDTVTIRIRTAHQNVDVVYLISGPLRLRAASADAARPYCLGAEGVGDGPAGR